MFAGSSGLIVIWAAALDAHARTASPRAAPRMVNDCGITAPQLGRPRGDRSADRRGVMPAGVIESPLQKLRTAEAHPHRLIDCIFLVQRLVQNEMGKKRTRDAVATGAV